MSIKNLEIKPSEAKAVEIASLPTRPTSSSTYGGRGLTAQEMKKAYDAYPALIKERFNALIADLLSGIAISDIPFSIPSHEPFGDNIEQTVKGFLDAVGDILDFGTDNARTIFGFVKQFVNNVAKATSLEYDKSTQLLSLTIDGQEKSVKFDDIGTLQTNIGTLQTDMSGAKGEITILKDRMELAETDISVNAGDITRLTDSVDENTTAIADLKSSKLDKTGGTISGDLEVAGNLWVIGQTIESVLEKLNVKDAVIVTNAEGATLAVLSGFATRTGSDTTYGIMYDPASNSVKLGIVTTDENGVWRFAEGEGSPVATRADSADMADGKVITWNAAKRRMETTEIPAVVDSIPSIVSDNLVTSGGVYDAISNAYGFALETAGQIDLSYNEEKEELTMTRTVENKVIPLTGVIALKDRVDFLSTLLFNTIITMTEVEDTYTSRVTAGGLPVVSNTPTTVHKIAGETKASENLFDLSNIGSGVRNGITFSSVNNNLTLSGTLEKSAFNFFAFELPAHLYGKTVTFSQSKYFSSFNATGCVSWIITKIKSDGSLVEIGRSNIGSYTMTFDEANVTYRIYLGTSNWVGSTCDEETISFMVNLGETALPYSDYYAGLKNASFNGIASTGSNLVDIYGLVGNGITKRGVTIKQEQDGYLHFSGIPTGSYRVLFTISQDLFQDGETYTFAQSDYFGKYGVAYTTKNAVYWKVSRKNLATGETNYSLISTDAVHGSVTFDKTTYSYNIDIVTGSYAYTSGDEMDVSLRFWINRGSTALPYENYTTDTSFQLSAARQLRKWDYIDVDNQRVVTGTAEVTQETAFTDEELATYPAGYILSADRKTISYPLETPTTAALTVPKTYTAWRNGSETVDTGATDALPPTITQTYYEEVTA